MKIEDGFFHCKECNWDLCLNCLSAYHPELIEKRCVKPKRIGHLCPLKCNLNRKLSKSDLINHLINSCEEMLVKCNDCKASWKRGHIPKMEHDRYQCIMKQHNDKLIDIDQMNVLIKAHEKELKEKEEVKKYEFLRNLQ